MEPTPPLDLPREPAVRPALSAARTSLVSMRWWARWWRRGAFWAAVGASIALIALLVAGFVAMHDVVQHFGGGRAAMTISGAGLSAVAFVAFWGVWAAYTLSFLRARAQECPAASAYYRARILQCWPGALLTRHRRTVWVETARSSGQVNWVDERVGPWFASATLTHHAVEPERVGNSFAQFEVSFGAISLGVGSLQAFGRNWVAACIWFGVGLVMIGRLALRGALFEPVVAGQGWVQHGRARWTVEDSVLVIKRQSARSVHATLVGPAGAMRVTLPSSAGRDAHLRAFWSRWAHPHPRFDQQAFSA